MYTEETFDFSNISAAQSPTFLEPGMYRLKVDKAGTKLMAPENKTPYVLVRFVSESGAAINEKFYITKNALPRLQYLHEAWTSKRLDQKFTSMVQIGEYFVKMLTSKIVTRPMVTGGKISADGKFYSGLPYTGFVVTDEALFEEGAFDKDSAQYNRVVTKEKPNPVVAMTNSAILPGMDAATPANPDDMPW